MHFHIILTELCNSKCKYCYEKSMNEFNNGLEKKFQFDFSAPSTSKIDLNKLKKFILKDKNPMIIFYGGEPLLEIEKIKKIINLFKNTNVKFRMQTNAKLLNELPINYLKKIGKILVSIDGNEKLTNHNRGKGTYELVLKNLKKAKQQGYRGEIVARMTISQEFPKISPQTKHLLKTRLFDSIHWQLDLGFYKNDFEIKKIKKFVKTYNKQISKLTKFWKNNLKKGKVLKLYPFLGIFENILEDKPTKLMCGAGHSGYTITTNGKITACPIMNNIKNFYCGTLNSNPNKLKKIHIISPCTSCNYFKFCGGRCLYSNYAKLWPKQGQELICNTIKHTIEEIKKITPEIKKLIKNKIISKNDFNYEKYFGPEIIP